MFLRRITTTAILTLLPLAPAGLAHAAMQASASGNHVTHFRTLDGPLDAAQPALAANGCNDNAVVGTPVAIDVSGPVARAAQKGVLIGRWKAELTYASGHGPVRARVPINGDYYGYRNDVEFAVPCWGFTRLAQAGFGAGPVSIDRFRVVHVTATLDGRTYAVGSSPILHQRVRPMYRAVARSWHRSGSRVRVVGVAQRWVRHGKRYQWRNTGAGVPVVIDTSCRTKAHVRRTGPRGRFVFTTTRARFRDPGFFSERPMVQTRIRNTRARSGETDGWWWRSSKHRFDELEWGLYCEE